MGDDSELASGTDVGGYVVERKIGEGGMGVVYGATQPRIGKRVAIKILGHAYCRDPEVVARFEGEARVVNEIRHPNIVDVFQFGELPDGRSYFVMEWLDGESLSARIDRGALPPHEAIDILDVMCDALAAAHEHNVVHRDLKSDNVFLVTSRRKRTVKLLDFGLAKLGRSLDSVEESSARNGIIVGTPAYMAPEQARNEPIDGRADIYALGCLTFKMLTGRVPFPGNAAVDIIAQQLHAPPPRAIELAPETPPALSDLLVAMMAKSADDRPSLADIRDVIVDLRGGRRSPMPGRSRSMVAVQGPTRGKVRLPAGTPERLSTPELRPPPARNRSVPVLVGLATVLVAVVGVAIVLLTRRHDTPTAQASPAEPAVTMTATAVEIDAGASEIEMSEDVVARGDAGVVVRPRAVDAGSAAGSGSDEAPTIIRRPGKLIVILQHAARIELDGKVVTESAAGGSYEVSPGEHTLKIIAPDREIVTRAVSVEPGGSAVIRIVDDPGDTAAPAPAADSDGSETP